MNVNKYILSVLALLLPIAIITRLNQIGTLFLYLMLLPVGNTNGVVSKINSEVGVQGGLSYEYYVNYHVGDKEYQLIELFSPDSLLNVNIDDSVALRYSKTRPQYATLKESKAHFADLGLLLVLLFFEIVILREAWRAWLQWNNEKKNKLASGKNL